MVISDKRREETEAEKLMALGPERSKSLHNFDMPRLNWGTQRLLRCMNVNPNAEALSSAPSIGGFLLWDGGGCGFGKKSKVKSDRDGGIEAVWEKLTFDFQADGDKTLKESAVFETADSEADAGHWRPRNSTRTRAANGTSGCCSGCSANGGVSIYQMLKPIAEIRRRRHRRPYQREEEEILNFAFPARD
ncbi:hypothetical protein Acr_25g0004790 [Actinidia rufa]|uniref:Uncharacterized protein n=1 Tax=Actinidia rufa TaxID=165716 RepID=A0A7J0GZ05_9ERIC|nr:hypothetical protein Acr_25g0004790 [Actinidia rufa]